MVYEVMMKPERELVVSPVDDDDGDYYYYYYYYSSINDVISLLWWEVIGFLTLLRCV